MSGSLEFKDLVVCSMTFYGRAVHAISAVVSQLNSYIPLDPPDIVSKNDEGFSIDMNNMEPLKQYMMTFEDSKYVLWKNENGALVIREV